MGEGRRTRWIRKRRKRRKGRRERRRIKDTE
jgi:hypothetical protein